MNDPELVANESDFAEHHFTKNMLSGDIEKLKKCGADLYEKIRDGKPAGITGSGSPDDFSGKLDDVISRYNSILNDV
jgi:hypothetical protein